MVPTTAPPPRRRRVVTTTRSHRRPPASFFRKVVFAKALRVCAAHDGGLLSTVSVSGSDVATGASAAGGGGGGGGGGFVPLRGVAWYDTTSSNPSPTVALESCRTSSSFPDRFRYNHKLVSLGTIDADRLIASVLAEVL